MTDLIKRLSAELEYRKAGIASNDETIDALLTEARDELERLSEVAKTKTPACLTQAQKERMPPVVWVSKEDHETLKQRLAQAESERDLLREFVAETRERMSAWVSYEEGYRAALSDSALKEKK